MGKEKKEKRKSEGGDEGKNKHEEWTELVSRVCPIASPLASRTLTKRLYKVVKKAQEKKSLRKGVREVQKFVRKGERGFVILAGDISPIDVITHMPAVCEEKDLPYCFTPSRQDLGKACGSNKSTCMLLVKPHEDFQEDYDAVQEDIKAMPQAY